MLLTKNTDYTRYEELKRTVICPSYFSEFLDSNASVPFVNEDMYTAEFRFKEVISVLKDKQEMAADTFDAFAHEKRLAIMKHLSAGQSSGNELARALNLSNYEIGEHTAILRKARMVRVEKMNQMLNFSLDKEAVRRQVGKALEDLLKDMKSYYRSSSFR